MTALTLQLLRVYYSIKKKLLTVYEIVNDSEHIFLQDSCNFQQKKPKFTIKKNPFCFRFQRFQKFQKIIWFSKMANLFTDSSLILKNLLFVNGTLPSPYYLK